MHVCCEAATNRTIATTTASSANGHACHNKQDCHVSFNLILQVDGELSVTWDNLSFCAQIKQMVRSLLLSINKSSNCRLLMISS